jgi:hypothetical protein
MHMFLFLVLGIFLLPWHATEARSHFSRCLYVLTECTITLSIAEVASGFLILRERSGAERRRDLEMHT